MTTPAISGRGRAATGVASRRAAVRERYLDAIEDAIRRGGSRVTMDDLAVAAGVSKPMLYAHFGDRVGVATALAVRVFDLQGRGLRYLRNETSPSIAPFLEFVENEPEIYRWLLRVTRDGPTVFEPFFDICGWRRHLEELSPVPEAFPSEMLVAGITGFVLAVGDSTRHGRR